MTKKKERSIVRATKSKDAIRLQGGIPLITDTTEEITPEKAQRMLQRNKGNRPVNWNKVEEYAQIMNDGKWKFHSQGIILDQKGNILTGQCRLLAIIYSGTPQVMRISKGTPSEAAPYIDRGRQQTSRDLASRVTQRKHSPTEASMARAICALGGKIKPSADDIAEVITEKSNLLGLAMKETKGTKKDKSMLMILGAICSLNGKIDEAKTLFGKLTYLADRLNGALAPMEADKCWNRGAAFTLAMQKAVEVVNADETPTPQS